MTNLQNNNKDNDKIELSDSSAETSENTSEEVITLEEINHHHHHHHHHSSSHSHHHHSSDHGHHHHNQKHKSCSRKQRIVKRVLIGILIFFLLIIVSLFAAYQISKSYGKKELLEGNRNVSVKTIDDSDSDDEGQTVYYKGEKYRYNENLISIVFMGVDKSKLGSETIGTSGQADAIYIFTYDTETDKCRLVQVSRETMTDVRLYSTSGKAMELEKMQLCLAYAYGDGRETSCENTLASLSKIFFNIPFTNYISLNWDSIAPLNDAIGGIKLTALEDIRTQYSNINKDEKITLMGNDAWSYVKYRDISKLTSNKDRLKRRKQYLKAYMSKVIPMAKKNFSVATDLIDVAGEYMCSNITTNKLVYIVSEILPTVYSSKDFDFITIDGKIKQGEPYAEFYPDETALYETILKVFYTKETK